ncbi:hypothetical protein NDU88_008966 [Pleurodeles waltl]|uniref:Uncharacterized protein n=1 Tax=Pleurodeles waltl TaxID=8319 RepID=A0AAV7RX90_PLEWA|nr:hypothetical protein NDU88_008966 [Pleurodeles waltl]
MGAPLDYRGICGGAGTRCEGQGRGVTDETPGEPPSDTQVGSQRAARSRCAEAKSGEIETDLLRLRVCLAADSAVAATFSAFANTSRHAALQQPKRAAIKAFRIVTTKETKQVVEPLLQL